VAVKIRLMRVGKRKQPTYRVVVADSRSPRDGRIIETIGHYGPRHEPSRVDIDGDRALAWLRKGAQPSESVQKLLITNGVWATFESEKKGPIDTKMNRRAWVTGRGVPAPKPKASKSEAAAEAPEPDAAKPEKAKAEKAKPETAKPETAKPETAKPETAKSEAAKSEATEPETEAAEAPESEAPKSEAEPEPPAAEATESGTDAE